MSINAPLLKKTLAKIEAEPERWYQGWWLRDISISPNVCETAFCFAGHAVILHGAELISIEAYEGDEMPDVFAKPPPGEPEGDYLSVDTRRIDGQELPAIDAYACQVLGLERGRGVDLFDADNTLDDLRAIVAELCAEAGEPT